jgi:HK97 family phage portal protein
MSVWSNLRYGLARMLAKSGGLSVISPWVRATFMTPTFEALTREGYQKNAVVTACIQAYTFMLPEPPLMVWDEDGEQGKPLPKHPLRQLLRKPNEIMGEDEFWQYIAAYIAIGGNAYGVCPLSARGLPVEMWPYHAGQVRPKPGGATWVMGFEFYNAQGEWETIDPTKYLIVHFKWPLPDLSQPWVAQPPLRSAAASVETVSELDRYLYSLLKNDAIPPTAVTLPPNVAMSKDEKDRFREQWKERYGGGNRGEIAILDDGAKIERISLDLEQLAFDALYRAPEAKIAAVFRVPPILAGLLVGLDASTYSNYEQARKAFTQDALVPLWRAIAAEVENGLAPAFGNGVAVRHDLNEVASLQEDVNAKWARVNTAFLNGWLGMKETRAAVGYGDPPTDDLYRTTISAGLEPLSAILAPPPPVVTEIPPRQLPAPQEPPDDSTESPKRRASKAAVPRLARALQRLRATLVKRMERDVDAFFDGLAARVEGRTGKALPSADDLITADDWLSLEKTVKKYYVEIISASWETWNEALGTEVAFELSDPAVVAALKDAGSQVRAIRDTTRDELRGLLQYGAEQGWTAEQLRRGDDTRPGVRDLIAETYKNRARTIARTELANAQQVASVERYKAAGVKNVIVFDNGTEDSDPTCTELNGTTQTLAWARANALQHPNCVRAFGPAFED